MKKLLFACSASLVFVGCATHESDRVATTPGGTKVYGLDEQPQSNITGVGPLMKPAHDPARVQPGQFTGKEDASDRIGQYPVTPRESSGEEFRRGDDEVSAQGTGAGTLGQTGIRPGPVSASAILSKPLDTSVPSLGANSQTADTAPTLSEPPSERENNIRVDKSMGASAAVESGADSANVVVGPENNEEIPSAAIDPRASAATGVPAGDLSGRIRETLSTSPSDSVAPLNTAELDALEIESINGNVTLRGPVRSETERATIGNRVSRVEGVRSVNNQLEVVSPARKELIDQAAPGGRQEPLE